MSTFFEWLRVTIELLIFFTILVGIHELGHLLAAKANKIRVDAFSIGMGPTLLKKKIGETLYTLKALLVGGYVSILGEDYQEFELTDDKGNTFSTEEVRELLETGQLEDMVDAATLSEAKKYFADLDSPRNFRNKRTWQKVSVLLAGVAMNFLSAVVVYYFLLSRTGFSFFVPSVSVPNYEPLFGELNHYGIVYTLSDEGVAKEVGLPDVGIIENINGNKVGSFAELKYYIESNKGKDITAMACDETFPQEVGCHEYQLSVPPEGIIGIELYSPVDVVSYKGVEKVFAGFIHPLNYIQIAIEALGNSFADAKQTGDYTQVRANAGGPILLAQILQRLENFDELLALFAGVSLSLVVVNLLPIPALDGGRVLLVLYEAIFKRPINKKLESKLIKWSFIFLMLLMLVIFVKDIVYFDDLAKLLG